MHWLLLICSEPNALLWFPAILRALSAWDAPVHCGDPTNGCGSRGWARPGSCPCTAGDSLASRAHLRTGRGRLWISSTLRPDSLRNGGMRPSRPLPPELSSPFTLSRGLAAGVSAGRLRGSDLQTPSRALRIPLKDEPTLLERCRPHAELLPGAVISHTTAARIHKMVLPRREEADPTLHLSREPSQAVPRRRLVTGHRIALTGREIVAVSGLAVTSVERTWLDLASVLSVDELVVAGDHLVSGHHRPFGPPRFAVIPLAELTAYVNSKKWLPYLQHARDALSLMRVGVDSPPESWLRLLLHHAGMPEFVPNYPLMSAQGYPVVWTDLACERFRTCLEYDGGHHLSPEQQHSDHRRDLLTAEAGWHQVKISKEDMRRGKAAVLTKVQRGLRMGGWTPGPSCR